MACPGGVDNACNGRNIIEGACNIDGTCTCLSNVFGAACEIECAGGRMNACSLSGACSPLDGSCTCFRNATHGYFTGPNCSDCAAGYAGSRCTVRCSPNSAAKLADMKTCAGVKPRWGVRAKKGAHGHAAVIGPQSPPYNPAPTAQAVRQPQRGTELG